MICGDIAYHADTDVIIRIMMQYYIDISWWYIEWKLC